MHHAVFHRDSINTSGLRALESMESLTKPQRHCINDLMQGLPELINVASQFPNTRRTPMWSMIELTRGSWSIICDLITFVPKQTDPTVKTTAAVHILIAGAQTIEIGKTTATKVAPQGAEIKTEEEKSPLSRVSLQVQTGMAVVIAPGASRRIGPPINELTPPPSRKLHILLSENLARNTDPLHSLLRGLKQDSRRR